MKSKYIKNIAHVTALSAATATLINGLPDSFSKYNGRPDLLNYEIGPVIIKSAVLYTGLYNFNKFVLRKFPK